MALLGAPTTRAHYIDLTERGVRKVFAEGYKVLDSGYIERVYNVVSSEKRQETDVVVAGLGAALPKTEGASPYFDSMQEAWKVVYLHLTWALGIVFTEEAIEDNLYMNLAATGGQELANALAYTRQVQAWDLFNDLTTTAYTAGGTNYPILSTTHYRVDGGTWSNRPASSTGLSIEALETALQQWTSGMLDQRGRKYDARPAILVVGPSDEFLAKRLVNSTLRPQTHDNDVNAIRDRNLEVFVNPHMTDDGRWFLLAPKERTGLTYFDRVAPMVRRYDTGDTGNIAMVARMRNSHGMSNPGGVYGSP
jgi:hypothetical protein